MDKNPYRHDRRADKNPYRHDRRADKNPYRHDRRADSQCRQNMVQLFAEKNIFIFTGTIGSESPRHKTISARDTGARTDFITGIPRPGTPRPNYNKIFVEYRNLKNRLFFKS